MHNLRSKYGHTFACFSLRHEIKHTMQQLVLLLLCEGYKHGNVQEGFLITETCKKVSLSRKRARRLPYHGNLEQGFLIKETCKKVSGSRKHSERFPDHGNLELGFRITETFSKASGSRKPSAIGATGGRIKPISVHIYIVVYRISTRIVGDLTSYRGGYQDRPKRLEASVGPASLPWHHTCVHRSSSQHS